jgi:hypothetical protein
MEIVPSRAIAADNPYPVTGKGRVFRQRQHAPHARPSDRRKLNANQNQRQRRYTVKD